MLRLIYVILVSLPLVIFYVILSRHVVKHIDKYSEIQRYDLVRKMINIMKRNGRIITEVFGKDNLPQDGGYVMYSNHQGKYDALGIIYAHDKPCTFVIDEKRSSIPFAKEISDLLQASRLDKTDPRKQLKTISDIVEKVSSGKRVLIFPEGGYDNNKNNVMEFLSGAFRCSIKSRTPIIPVAIKDSYKVFGVNSLKKVRTEVHFLKPLYYEEYEKLSSSQIAKLVQSRITAVLNVQPDAEPGM